MSIHVIAHVRAKPENIDAVKTILEGFISPTRVENGCIVYNLYQDKKDPAHFTFVEEWADEDMLMAHSRSKHLTEGRAKLKELTQVPNEVLRYERLA